jgi:feruloyl esterase
MSGLSKIISELAHYRKVAETLRSASTRSPAEDRDGRLVEIADFGVNPGNLRMLVHAPEPLAPRPGLVVVLHGCTQTAQAYDLGSGWSTLADAHGFALLYPEQKSANNANTCFSWFDPAHIARDKGEAASIRNMIERMAVDLDIDRDRIFVTGLSAGGAMTNVMLATYPEVFAAGAVIAGLPYGSARNVHEAFRSMFSGASRGAHEWGALVRDASPHRGHWPKVSIWHGEADATVVPSNAQEIVKQWTDVHALPHHATSLETHGGHHLRQWRDEVGELRIEEHLIAGMSHGAPLTSAEGQGVGVAGPFMLDVGISSTLEIARFFGLLTSEAVVGAPVPKPETRARRTPDKAPLESELKTVVSSVEKTIAEALRKAGLLR